MRIPPTETGMYATRPREGLAIQINLRSVRASHFLGCRPRNHRKSEIRTKFGAEDRHALGNCRQSSACLRLA
jgi:hypothetical protein